MSNAIPPLSQPSSEPPAPRPPVFDPHLFPSRHRPFRQFLLDHNPCLLLSTVCMLLGCYLVNTALKDQDQNIKRIALLAVMNLYEICIIPLGLVLIRRTRGTARDGWWLLLFELLFLVNATFINVDFGLGGWRWSFLFNAALFLLACVKTAIIFRGLKIGLGLRTYGFFTLMLAIIYGLPLFFAWVNVDGVVSPKIMYALWWLVGLLPLLYDQLARADRKPRQWDLVQRVIRRVYLIAPWVMLVAHMGFSHWAHHSNFYLPTLTPIFLGLAIAAARVCSDASSRLAIRILPLIGLFLSLQTTNELQWTLHFPDGAGVHILTPLHAAIPAVLLTYGYLASPFALLCAVCVTFVAGAAFLFQQQLVRATYWLLRHLLDALPNTPLAWGITSIILAFFLLAVGSFISLKRTWTAHHTASG